VKQTPSERGFYFFHEFTFDVRQPLMVDQKRCHAVASDRLASPFRPSQKAGPVAGVFHSDRARPPTPWRP